MWSTIALISGNVVLSGMGLPFPSKLTLPARIEIDVDEAVVLQARGFECIGLRDHVRLRQEVALDGLLAEAAPAKIGFLAGVIDLCARAGQESDNHCNHGEKGKIRLSHRSRPR